MDRETLHTLTLRAVELAVQDRHDPRLLLCTRLELPGPRKTAALLAGMANAAAGRQTLLLVGLDTGSVLGMLDEPSLRWWDRFDRAFVGARPDIHHERLDVSGAVLWAFTTDPVDEMVPVRRGGRVRVPWIDADGQLVDAPVARRQPSRSSGDGIPTARVLDGWIERTVLDARDGDDRRIAAFQGRVDVELVASPGVLADQDCSATLLFPGATAVQLDTQIHPVSDDVGVLRHEDGIEVRTDYRARLFMAAAVRDDATSATPSTAQLVVSFRLPGRAVPELQSLLLTIDPKDDGQRWRI